MLTHNHAAVWCGQGQGAAVTDCRFCGGRCHGCRHRLVGQPASAGHWYLQIDAWHADLQEKRRERLVSISALQIGKCGFGQPASVAAAAGFEPDAARSRAESSTGRQPGEPKINADAEPVTLLAGRWQQADHRRPAASWPPMTTRVGLFDGQPEGELQAVETRRAALPPTAIGDGNGRAATGWKRAQSTGAAAARSAGGIARSLTAWAGAGTASVPAQRGAGVAREFCASSRIRAAFSPTTWAWAKPPQTLAHLLLEKEAGRLARPAPIDAADPR